MSIQVLIIGLGQFGMSLARTLSEKGTEVIAVDQDKELVDEAAGFLDDALCLDATDETALGARCCNLCNRCKRTVYTYNSNFKTDGM